MRIYLGTFLIALATLALEVALTRLLSLTTWYHLAFFAISTAMLGMTAGAVRVYLRPARYSTERFGHEAALACIGFAVSVPCMLALLCLIPAGLMLSSMGIVSLLASTAACSVPFYFSGVAVTLALTKSPLPIGRVYAADLIGAALGCLFALGALQLRGAPSLMLWCAGSGALAAPFFATLPRTALVRAAGWLLAGGLAVAGFVNTYGPYGIYPVVRKGMIEMPTSVSAQGYGVFTLVELERWNALSRVSVSPEQLAPPRMWAPSAKLPLSVLPQRELHIDGGASTTIRRFASMADIEHLKYDVVNVPYYLRPRGGAAIIGLGGGKDPQSAILFGHERVVAIDVNPSIVGLLENEFREFAGLAGRPGVSLVADDARSYLTHTDERFALIQMSLIDSWAATMAGAFTLSENALYTLEAWETFLGRLTDDGVFTVSRFFNPTDLSETGRLVSLGVAALQRIGASEPARHLAMVTNQTICTLLLSRRPLTDADIVRLREVCADLGFDPAIVPGTPCADADLRAIVAARTPDELRTITASKALNYDPPTDEDPYFFNLLRLEHLSTGFAHAQGVLGGNLMATFVLMGLIASLLFVALATIVVPLLLRSRAIDLAPVRMVVMVPGALYFSAIGAGFMFAQIALIQRLSVFLGHPTYALGVLLFTMILSSGCGSLLSERLPVTRRAWLLLCPLVAGASLWALDLGLSAVLGRMITSGQGARIAVAVALIAPLGLVLGFFFPTGMRLARDAGSAETPWFWALNGVFGVLCSAAAVLVSLYFGISTNLRIAGICYVSVAVFALALRQAALPRAALR